MPTYEYKCRSCGHIFEKLQAMSDKPIRNCPECGGRVDRLISGGSGIIFKGSGFYATDYGRAGGPACGRDTPCCGRETPCERRPCD